MKVSQATRSFLDYHRMNSKKNTLRNYVHLLTEFSAQFGDREADSLTSEEILSFLGHLTEGLKQSTKRLRFSSCLLHLHHKHGRGEVRKSL